MNDLPVIIAGGGIGALATALGLGLARKGFATLDELDAFHNAAPPNQPEAV